LLLPCGCYSASIAEVPGTFPHNLSMPLWKKRRLESMFQCRAPERIRF
jgi:hypothetical protein